MKGKVIRGSGFRGVLNYILRMIKDMQQEQELIEIVGGNMEGSTARELAAEFKASRQLSPDCKKPVWHCPLSLPPGDRLTHQKWHEVCQALMEEMDFSPAHQFVAMLHNDTECQHVHIVASRIGLDAKIWYGQHEARRLIAACQRIEERFGLTLTKGLTPRPSEVAIDNNALKPKRDRVHRKSLQNERTGKPTLDARAIALAARDALKTSATPDELRAALAERDIKVEFRERGDADSKEIYGWTLAGLSASTIDRSLSWAKVQKLLDANARLQAEASVAQSESRFAGRTDLGEAIASVDRILSEQPLSQLRRLRKAAMQREDVNHDEKLLRLLRRLLDLMVQVLSFGALRVAGTAQERDQAAKAALVTRIDKELQRRQEQTGQAALNANVAGMSPPISVAPKPTKPNSPPSRIVKTHDGRANFDRTNQERNSDDENYDWERERSRDA